ncbi:hypothetical protein H696_02695, partial [Fonticula alba]
MSAPSPRSAGLALLVGLLALLGMLTLAPRPTSALHFYLEQSTPRCFLEDLPGQTLVLGDAELRVYEGTRLLENHDFNAALEVKEKFSGHTIYSSNLGSRGTFAFTTVEPGEHLICFRSSYASWRSNARSRLDFTMTIGEATLEDADPNSQLVNSGDDAAIVDRVNNLRASLRRMNVRIADIRRAQSYQRVQEASFRDASERVNSRVAWFLIVQIVVFVGVALWQMAHLRSFFTTRRVV